MSSTANVTVGKPKTAGSAYYKTGTVTPPTSTTASLTGYTNCGYISEDGLKNESKRDTTEIKAWGGDVVKKPTTGFTDTFKYKLIEGLNTDVLKIVYGSSNVSTDGTTNETTVNVKSADLEIACWVFDMIVGENKTKRIVIPKGQITEVAEITYKDSDVVGYEVTMTAYPDTNGSTHYEYIK